MKLVDGVIKVLILSLFDTRQRSCAITYVIRRTDIFGGGKIGILNNLLECAHI